MDLDTFLTTLYVWIDDWYKAEMAEKVGRKRGPAPEMSDSEVLTVAIAGQWRAGVPWQSERSVVRYMQEHGRGWFPTMLGRSRFNERVRCLWAVVVKAAEALAQELGAGQSGYEVVDCIPLPSCSKSQARRGRGHWLWWGTHGHGGSQGGWYWGDQAIVSVTPEYAITGWLLGPSHVDDRVMLQALLSQRHGGYEFITPMPWRPWRQLTSPEFICPLQAAGAAPLSRRYLADKGFNGFKWQQVWHSYYGVSVLTEPSRNAQNVHWPPLWGKQFRGLRQVVETAFAILTVVFTIKHLNAHSRWGQITRFAIAVAAFNWGIWLNRCLGRAALSHATLLC